MKAIVAVDIRWGIGKNNDLLFNIPRDMQYFKEQTLGKVIVMGSNTLKSFPGGRPLKNRTNIVLYPNGEKRSDCVIVGSLDELKAELKKYNSDDIFIVGGAMFYKTMLYFCDSVLVTKVESDGEATVFFENLDADKNFKLIYKSEGIIADGFVINFNEYKNLNPKPFM